MTRLRLTSIVVSTVLIGALLSACGAPSDAERAAENQLALAATVAAAPRVDAVATLPATAAPTSAPTSVPATSLPTSVPPTSAPPTAPADTGATSAQARALAVSAATEVAQASRPTAAPIKAPAPPTKAPAVQPSPAPAQAQSPEASPVPPSPVPASPAPPSATPEPPPAPSDAPVAAPPDDGTPVVIAFEDLYSGASITGPVLSDTAKKLDGRRVTMVGYMAPPLKPDLDFFVLTKTPMVYCPFCSSAADWPFDIVFVRMAASKTVPGVVPSQGLRVTGTFSVGTATDAATGFVSQVRIIADSVEELR